MRDDGEASLDLLMERLSTGDRTAFTPLFRALRPRALRFARVRLPADLADDVAQSALLRVFAHAPRFRAGHPVMPWFYATVANEIRAARRQQHAHVGLDPESARPSEDEGPEAQLLTAELLAALQQAIGALDDDAASVIRAQLGQTPRPTLTPTTFRKRVSRAYTRLRMMLGESR